MTGSRVLALALLAIATAGHFTATATQETNVITRRNPRDLTDVPAAVRDELTRRGCTIPQADFDRDGRNVIRGNFFGTGTDWAVLCSRHGASSILVFQGATVHSDMVRRTDTDFLQGDSRGGQVFSRAIRTLSPKLIQEYERLDDMKGPSPTHDGISDAFQGKASDAWYWYRGKWIAVGHWD
jgi:hypothetical protein